MGVVKVVCVVLTLLIGLMWLWCKYDQNARWNASHFHAIPDKVLEETGSLMLGAEGFDSPFEGKSRQQGRCALFYRLFCCCCCCCCESEGSGLASEADSGTRGRSYYGDMSRKHSEPSYGLTSLIDERATHREADAKFLTSGRHHEASLVGDRPTGLSRSGTAVAGPLSSAGLFGSRRGNSGFGMGRASRESSVHSGNDPPSPPGRRKFREHGERGPFADKEFLEIGTEVFHSSSESDDGGSKDSLLSAPQTAEL